jgi:hypothetical protein
VDQPEIMRRMHSPGELDRDIEDMIQLCESALRNPGLERASLHILGEDGQFFPDSAEKPADDEVWYSGRSSQICSSLKK